MGYQNTCLRYLELLDIISDGIYFTDENKVIVHWNKAAERISGYSREEVLGKKCSDSLLIHVNNDGKRMCSDACPMEAVMTDGGFREKDIYLRHKEGHRVPVLARVLPLNDESGKPDGAIQVFSEQSRREALLNRINELERLALTDPLTHMPNRRFLESALQERFQESLRYGVPFGVMLFDIDHFKSVNDEYGHNAGDDVLRTVGKTLLSSTRPFDTIGRWGGEEFLGVVRNINTKEIYNLAERLRLLVASSTTRTVRGPVDVTVSGGVATIQPDENIASLLRRVDECLYISKNNGRNRITSHESAIQMNV